MSYDLNIATVCDHKVYREPVSLASDRKTIKFTKPLASSNLDLYASDDLVPKTEYTILFDSAQPPQSKTNKMIVFRNKWKAVEDYFEISYQTLSPYCPKCVGMDQIDDISYDIRGNLLLNRNESLLLQNVEKFTVTDLQSNAFHPFIGTGLVGLLGQRITNQAYITSKVTQEITSTLTVFQDLQRQYMSAGRTMTVGEILDAILSIKVNFDAADPSILRADIAIRARSGKTVNFSQFLKIA